MKFPYTDYHIHTYPWSHDIKQDGPRFQDYCIIAEKKQVNICFLDHYELYYIERDRTYPFSGEGIIIYLEELDKIKEQFEFVLGGLEVDYYPDKKNELKTFMDEYDKEFDFIAGSLHDVVGGYPVTTREKLIKLIKIKSVKEIVDHFFNLTKSMIKSQIFKNICHLDTVFRYINQNDIQPTQNIDISNERILNLGRLCIKNNIKIEYNLSGSEYPIGRSFPSKNMVNLFAREGAQFFIGSDSHSLHYFKKTIPQIKSATKFINNLKKEA